MSETEGPDAGENLARLSYEKQVVQARMSALKLRIRRGEVVSRSKAEAMAWDMGVRIRDQLLTASSRHAALLAAEFGVPAPILAVELDAMMRRILTRMADDAEVGS